MDMLISLKRLKGFTVISRISLCVGLILLTNGALKAQLSLDTFDPQPNGNVAAIALQDDGKILIAGSFMTLSPNGGSPVARNRLARFFADGSLDNAFSPNVNGTVNTIVLQQDGKILICGDFSNINGTSRNYVARLDPITGEPDGFQPIISNGMFGPVLLTMSVQPDGKVLIGGSFSSVNGQPRNNIARLESTTGVPDSFSPNASSIVRSIALQSDGKVLVCGGFDNIGGQNRNYMARLNPTDGSADSFDPSPNNQVVKIRVQPDGKILVGGLFDSIGTRIRNLIARLSSATGIADSFNPNVTGSNPISEIVVQSDGKIIVGGLFSLIGGFSRRNVARLDSDTGIPDSFNPVIDQTVYSIALQANGNILVGGNFSIVSGQQQKHIARFVPVVSVTIGGRVVSASGRGLQNITISLTDANGQVRSTRTTSFGYYRFSEINTGQTVTISASGKRYLFDPLVVYIRSAFNNHNFTSY